MVKTSKRLPTAILRRIIQLHGRTPGRDICGPAGRAVDDRPDDPINDNTSVSYDPAERQYVAIVGAGWHTLNLVVPPTCCGGQSHAQAESSATD